MSITTDNLFEVTIVKVTPAEAHIAAIEMSNEALYLRVNNKMLRTKTPVEPVSPVLLDTVNRTNNTVNY